MANKNFRFSGMTEGIRLITVILFFLFISPGIIIPRGPLNDIHTPTVYFLLNLLVCLAFIGLEILEQTKWSYHYETPAVPRILFFLRFVLIFIPNLFVLRGIINNPVFPEFLWRGQINHVFMLLSLLPFYAYYTFPRKISLIFLILSILLSLSYDIFGKTIDHQNAFELGFTLYRTLTFAFFYIMAWLLDKQRKSVRENKQLLGDLRASENRLREYADRIGQTVALEERTRLAQDIHDSLGHSLTVVKIQQNKALAYLKLDPEESEKALLAAKASAEDAMSDIRTSLKRLNGGEAAISLKESFSDFSRMLEENGLETDFQFTGCEKGYNYSVLMGLYRLAQEGITNILKHASAGSVKLRTDFGADEALFLLADDGCGFDMGEDYLSNKDSEQYGLKGLIRRIELVNGRLEIESAPGKGTTLTARVPRNPLAVNEENHG